MYRATGRSRQVYRAPSAITVVKSVETKNQTNHSGTANGLNSPPFSSQNAEKERYTDDIVANKVEYVRRMKPRIFPEKFAFTDTCWFKKKKNIFGKRRQIKQNRVCCMMNAISKRPCNRQASWTIAPVVKL